MVKSERLTIKLLPSDKRALVALAAFEGEPVAVVVRRLIRQAAREAQAHVGGDSSIVRRSAAG